MTSQMQRLEQFLDESLPPRLQRQGLRDSSIPDEVVIAFIAGLSRHYMIGALDELSRPVVLREFAGHPDPAIRAVVAENRVVEGAILQRLAGDPEPEVRYQVARHPSTTSEVLEDMLGDPIPWVADAAVQARWERRDWSVPAPAPGPSTHQALGILGELVGATEVADQAAGG